MQSTTSSEAIATSCETKPFEVIRAGSWFVTYIPDQPHPEGGLPMFATLAEAKDMRDKLNALPRFAHNQLGKRLIEGGGDGIVK